MTAFTVVRPGRLDDLRDIKVIDAESGKADKGPLGRNRKVTAWNLSGG